MKIKINNKELTELCIIMQNNKSDKGGNNCWHNYTYIYNELFKNIRFNKLDIFELGIGSITPTIPFNMSHLSDRHGASLYGWKEYFPKSNIYGADIDRDSLFNIDRIKTFYCDQTDKVSIKNLWDNHKLLKDFDIIIEDGLHEFYANVCFFENSIHKVKSGGFFIIEDIKNIDLYSFEEIIKKWQDTYPSYIFKLIEIDSNINNYDNNMLIVIKN